MLIKQNHYEQWSSHKNLALYFPKEFIEKEILNMLKHRNPIVFNGKTVDLNEKTKAFIQQLFNA